MMFVRCFLLYPHKGVRSLSSPCVVKKQALLGAAGTGETRIVTLILGGKVIIVYIFFEHVCVFIVTAPPEGT